LGTLRISASAGGGSFENIERRCRNMFVFSASINADSLINPPGALTMRTPFALASRTLLSMCFVQQSAACAA
jgi:hypothetical protein